jgi:hypothetical protein
VKVYLENSIFFFHKAHPPPAKGKRKATPPLFLPAPRPNPEWNGSPPPPAPPPVGEVLPPRHSRNGTPRRRPHPHPATRTPRRLRPDPMFATPCLQARGAGNLPAALHPVSPASCAPPSPCDPHPPPPAPRPDVRHTVLAGEGSGQLACRPSPRLTCVLRPAFTLRPAPPAGSSYPAALQGTYCL